MSTPPGWYPAPGEHATQRYWNGEAWTEERAPLEVKTDESTTTWLIALLAVVGVVVLIIALALFLGPLA